MSRLSSSLLLKLNGCASFFQSLFGFFGFRFLSSFLKCGRCAINHFFGFFESKTGNAPDCLDDVDFLVAGSGQNDIKLVLFLGRRRIAARLQ